MRILFRLRERSRSGGSDRGSLALALLIAIVGSGIAAMLVPMMLAQFGTSRFDNSRTRELNAAEAGTEVALGLVRSATDTHGNGKVSNLPCTNGSGLTGSVAGSAAGLTYRVRIGYYVENPLGQSAAWLAPYTVGGAGHGMICANSTGTYYPPTKDSVPSYVLVTATGTDARDSRTLRSTYVVQTTNANVDGGTIYIYPSAAAGGSKFCMDAGSAQGVIGVQISLQPCAQTVVPAQAWAYRSDLSIQLVSSVTSANVNGLCLSAFDYDRYGTKVQNSNTALNLQPCTEVGQTPWYQMWSVDDSAHLRNANPSATDTGTLCINAPSQGAGVLLALSSCAGGVTDPQQTWVPSPDVGAGMAGASNNQLVNFLQFGRCLDVTNFDVNAGYLIAYTCKQNPSPSKVGWNEKFVYNTGTREWVTNNGSPYCLTSPGKLYDGAASGEWVTVTPCPKNPTAAVTWTANGATDASGNPLASDVRYTIKDSGNLCLSLTTDSAVAHNGQYSKAIMAKCDGSTLQKWNADAEVHDPTVQNFMEIQTTS